MDELRISNESVRKATGKAWPEWSELLNEKGCTEWSHTEIAALVERDYKISPWWSQAVANGYEILIGRRVVGGTIGVNFEVGVQRTTEKQAENVWHLLMSPASVKIWLGEGVHLKGEVGEYFQTKEGFSGELRVIKPGSRLRLTWKKAEWPTFSTVQITLLPKSDSKTSVHFHQENLANLELRAVMATYWKNIAEQLLEVWSK